MNENKITQNDTTPTFASYKERYPLHTAAWFNDCNELEQIFINDSEIDKEELDPRGRTPLMLAVTLCNLEAATFFLDHGCSAVAENNEGWTVVQEATATGNSTLLSKVLESRDVQKISSRLLGIPSLLTKLSEAPDFYVEMKWEFTSWVPLVSRMCPSDTYKVYKRGSFVRIDTTLLGFDQTQWQRGNRSYIFKGTGEGAIMLEVDHDARQVYQEVIATVNPREYSGNMKPHMSVVSQRLRSPIVTSYIDTEKISFERDKQGIWGWRNDRSEMVNGQDCKVFSASNVELVTKTRTEHLSESDKKQNLSPASPIQSFLSIAELEDKKPSDEEEVDLLVPTDEEIDRGSEFNPCNIQPEDYFDPNKELNGDNIGRPKENTAKIQKFKGHLWLAENYPLRLQEQVMPIVDLMAISSSHFAKLKDFIQMQLPSGFPVKIEIPLFHVLTARITFGNIFGLDSAVGRVSTLQEEERLACIIEDSIFEAPSSYSVIGSHDAPMGHRQIAMEEDDALLQYAIQQSILESASGTSGPHEDEIDIWEALQSSQKGDISSSASSQNTPIHAPITPNHTPISSLEESQLQRAIEESLAMSMGVSGGMGMNVVLPQATPTTPTSIPSDDDIAIALSLSRKEQLEQEQRRQQEDEILSKILELSLTEK